jgi:hypothetical protein
MACARALAKVKAMNPGSVRECLGAAVNFNAAVIGAASNGKNG